MLAEELSVLRLFVQLLHQEQAALVNGKADDLLSLADRKSSLATRLNDCSKQRDCRLAGLGFATSKAGMQSWLAGPGAAKAKAWQELLVLAAEAKALNELNGKLIGTRMQHNQSALAALLAATERAMTYGPDGQTTARPGSGAGRILGSA